MTEQELILLTRVLSVNLSGLVERLPLSAEDALGVVSGAFAETLARQLGGIVPAVERMRDLADLMERQAFAGMERKEG